MERKMTAKQMQTFRQFLCKGEKSHITTPKYMRDVCAFAEYVGEREVCKSRVLTHHKNPPAV